MDPSWDIPLLPRGSKISFFHQESLKTLMRFSQMTTEESGLVDFFSQSIVMEIGKVPLEDTLKMSPLKSLKKVLK